MSAQDPVICPDSSKLTAFFCEKYMNHPEQQWYVLIEREKERLNEKNGHKFDSFDLLRSGWRVDFLNDLPEPDPKLDQATIDSFELYKKEYATQAKAGNWVDFLKFLDLDEKQRAEHLALLKQQRKEYNDTLQLMIKTKITFTPEELEKISTKAREFGIPATLLYDDKCWKEMVERHKDLSTIEKIWNAVSKMPEDKAKYRTLLVLYTHVYTAYMNQSVEGMNQRGDTLYRELVFKNFLHICLLEGKFDEEGYRFLSITSHTNARPQREYMRIVKEELLKKVAQIAARKPAPLLHSTQAQQATQSGSSEPVQRQSDAVHHQAAGTPEKENRQSLNG